ncbi:AAA family ATPase [Symmachiella dynata]|uniref:AAA family ATPase n=1 Tax=Symmachiella dynata TaxID=2527995 RepID=UPI0030EB61CE
MYIKKIDIRKYRHIENLTLGPFLPPSEASDCIVIAGPNGSGKSSVLELISQALANSWSLTYQLNRSAPDSSFEICVGLIQSELELIRDQFGEDSSNLDAINHLATHKSYFRSFKYEGGEYNRQSTLHNKIHNFVLKALKGDFLRPLGFHLGSERSYKKSKFEYKNKLFKYHQYSQNQHTWNFAFRTESEQFEDMFDYLITWQHNYFQQLGSYYHGKEKGFVDEVLGDLPEDRYGTVLSKVFPDYTFVHKPESVPTDLFIRIPSGDIIPFSDLSSGEK